MGYIEDWLRKAQGLIERLLRRMTAAEAAIKALQQSVRSQGQQQPSAGTPDGGGGGYYDCTLSVALNHGQYAQQQSVYTRQGASGRQLATSTGTIYNDGPGAAQDLVGQQTVLLAKNPDGSYTIIGVYC